MSDHKDEITNLNADDLDVEELDDKLLEDAAGGTYYQQDEARAPCTGFSCGDYWC